MSRIKDRLARLQADGARALIPYVMAGFPDEEATVAAVRGLVNGGADIIEIGFPFSDPLADGPVIQNAGTISLENGTNVAGFLRMVRRIRKETDIPLVLMTYANILYRRGYGRFVSEAADAGIDGLIIPDMSVEEAGEYLDAARGKVDTIFLVSPNTDRARVQRIAKESSGFLYLVAVYGTTGVGRTIKEYTIKAIRNAKECTGGGIPVGVGFGVSSPQDVRAYVKAGADAVIVGSAYLKLIQKTPRGEIESAVAAFTRELKEQTRLG